LIGVSGFGGSAAGPAVLRLPPGGRSFPGASGSPYLFLEVNAMCKEEPRYCPFQTSTPGDAQFCDGPRCELWVVPAFQLPRRSNGACVLAIIGIHFAIQMDNFCRDELLKEKGFKID